MVKISAVIIDTYPDKKMSNTAIKMVQRLGNLETIHVFSDEEPSTLEKINFIKIDPFSTANEYGHILFTQVPPLIKTSHFLVFQWDGFPLNPLSWSDEFLKYDYIGAPKGSWVGNGGFSLRSAQLAHKINELDIKINLENPYDQLEDQYICTHYRPLLEQNGIQFAPYGLANDFAYDAGSHGQFKSNVFGFHYPATFPMFLEESQLIELMGSIIARMSSPLALRDLIHSIRDHEMENLLREIYTAHIHHPNMVKLHLVAEAHDPFGSLIQLRKKYSLQK